MTGVGRPASDCLLETRNSARTDADIRRVFARLEGSSNAPALIERESQYQYDGDLARSARV
jgi:hypothetical protein